MDVLTAAVAILANDSDLLVWEGRYYLNHYRNDDEIEPDPFRCKHAIFSMLKWAAEREIETACKADLITRWPRSSGEILEKAAKRLMKVHPKNRKPIRDIASRRLAMAIENGSRCDEDSHLRFSRD